MSTKPIVHVVHCVDTEGPLEETLEATFERLWREKGLDLPPNLNTLTALQKKQIDLSGQEQDIADFIAPARLAYLSTWAQVEEMVLGMTDKDYRYKHASPDGNPYTFSWFIIDVAGYDDNPRRKPMGFNVVWDQYQRMLAGRQFNDAFGWHFHSVPANRHALHYNTSWTNNDFHEQALARRIIERSWFPALFRSGGVIERDDISYWLECFIPFDYSNQNNKYAEFAPGLQSDWRHAPMTWGSYHPDFHDYRKPGQMKRSIFRCLDIKNPGCRLDDADIQAAFEQARMQGHTVLAYTNHDRRDIRPEIEDIHKRISAIGKQFSDVDWSYSNALKAAQAQEEKPLVEAPQIQLSFEKGVLYIKSTEPSFSGNIFLAVEEEGQLFYRDNPSKESPNSWAYLSPRWNKVKIIGVALVTKAGETAIRTQKFSGGVPQS